MGSASNGFRQNRDSIVWVLLQNGFMQNGDGLGWVLLQMVLIKMEMGRDLMLNLASSLAQTSTMLQ